MDIIFNIQNLFSVVRKFSKVAFLLFFVLTALSFNNLQAQNNSIQFDRISVEHGLSHRTL
ncbi:MAG: hypothetical protein GY795_11640 [Desulfobacterales bacterium]|nr:hypothetical protein [Desulfobacterales bacterium]